MCIPPSSTFSLQPFHESWNPSQKKQKPTKKSLGCDDEKKSEVERERRQNTAQLARNPALRKRSGGCIVKRAEVLSAAC